MSFKMPDCDGCGKTIGHEAPRVIVRRSGDSANWKIACSPECTRIVGDRVWGIAGPEEVTKREGARIVEAADVVGIPREDAEKPESD